METFALEGNVVSHIIQTPTICLVGEKSQKLLGKKKEARFNLWYGVITEMPHANPKLLVVGDLPKLI